MKLINYSSKGKPMISFSTPKEQKASKIIMIILAIVAIVGTITLTIVWVATHDSKPKNAIFHVTRIDSVSENAGYMLVLSDGSIVELKESDDYKKSSNDVYTIVCTSQKNPNMELTTDVKLRVAESNTSKINLTVSTMAMKATTHSDITFAEAVFYSSGDTATLDVTKDLYNTLKENKNANVTNIYDDSDNNGSTEDIEGTAD